MQSVQSLCPQQGSLTPSPAPVMKVDPQVFLEAAQCPLRVGLCDRHPVQLNPFYEAASGTEDQPALREIQESKLERENTAF